jgi:hypothetical protein
VLHKRLPLRFNNAGVLIAFIIIDATRPHRWHTCTVRITSSCCANEISMSICENVVSDEDDRNKQHTTNNTGHKHHYHS